MAIGFVPQLLPEKSSEALSTLYERAALPLQVGAPAAVLCLVAVLAPAGVAPFIYFQF
jgi:hypothetical protein